MKVRHLSLLLALLPALAACGGNPQPARTAEEPPIQARVETVNAAVVNLAYEAVGTVRSKTTAHLSAKTVGHVTSVRVREGESVRAGQLLVEIDARDVANQKLKVTAGVDEAENALQEAEQSIRAAEAAKSAVEANLALATATYQRFNRLQERGSTSRQEFEEVEARYKSAVAEASRAEDMLQSARARKRQAQARIEQARADLQNTEVYASYARLISPMNGVVTAKNVELGNLAAPGAPLLTLEDNRNYQLVVSVDESRIGAVKPGAAVPVVIGALDEAQVTGRVAEIIPAADPGSRSFSVKLDLEFNPLLRSGMFGKARFAIGEKSAVVIPTAAVLERGQLTGVFVMDQSNSARYRLIRTGRLYGDRVEVISGLEPGDRLVLDEPHKLREGALIVPEGPVNQRAVID
jgi:multidrug efflux pump subunit AcrA (membrane-fusion protein)